MKWPWRKKKSVRQVPTAQMLDDIAAGWTGKGLDVQRSGTKIVATDADGNSTEVTPF